MGDNLRLAPGVLEAAQALLQEARRVVPVRVESSYRTAAQQRRLRRAYLSGRSRWPAAEVGQSAHEYGLAFDAVAGGNPDSESHSWFVRLARMRGWHVPVGDKIHFEVPNWWQYV